MSAINSKEQLCNMAQSHLGNYPSINNIDTPKSGAEIAFALWYDISRQELLKYLMPNFALDRVVVAQEVLTPAFGYKYAYPVPSNCLKVLGIGNIDEKLEQRVSIEGNKIYCDEDFTGGAEVRFIRDYEDVSTMSPEFKNTLATILAEKVALPVTQDMAKKQLAMQVAGKQMVAASAVNAQENPPVRRSASRFRASRYYNVAQNTDKK